MLKDCHLLLRVELSSYLVQNLKRVPRFILVLNPDPGNCRLLLRVELAPFLNPAVPCLNSKHVSRFILAVNPDPEDCRLLLQVEAFPL